MVDEKQDAEEAVERHEVSRVIPADAAAIFAVVSSPSGHVAIDASGMLQGWTGEAAKAVGDEFVVHMDREALGDLPMGKYDVTVRITGYEQDRFITWEVSGKGFPSIGHYYGYRLSYCVRHQSSDGLSTWDRPTKTSSWRRRCGSTASGATVPPSSSVWSSRPEPRRLPGVRAAVVALGHTVP